MGKDLPESLEPLLRQPVAVFGWGVSGRAVGKLLEDRGVAYNIYDEGRGYAFTDELATGHDLVVFSPGFRKDHTWIQAAHKAGCHCMGELEFGRHFWNGELIGVTGTNGKSTLTTLLAEALSGVACGNIGRPLSLCALEDDHLPVAVCEVSSFQAETLDKFELDALLWTNFAPDHLDRHGSEEHYFKAKWQLVGYTRGPIVLGESVVAMAEQVGVSLPEGVIIINENAKADLPKKSVFARYPQCVNYAMAEAYISARGGGGERLKSVAATFKGLPHRMEYVADIEGVGFWDDSKATNFNAALAGLSGFDKPVYWIGGGKDKGCDVSLFVKEAYQKIRGAFLIGETGSLLEKELIKCGVNVELCENLEDAVKKSFEGARISRTSEVLLSPGFSSFDQFKNFEERGNYFKKYVLGLNRGQNALKQS